jgi:protein-tyrosine phosphatase
VPPVLPPSRSRGRRHAVLLVLGALGLLLVANLAILGASFAARAGASSSGMDVPGAGNFRVVDEQVVRGKAPTLDGYRSLASLGVTTIVDLRAESNLEVPVVLLQSLGIQRIHMPIKDGQTPRPDQVQQFLDAVEQSEGLVYVHCGAGVGRTGAMSAAYLVASGHSSGMAAARANLEVGPPSLEQIFYAASLESDDTPKQPPDAVKALSRALDAPRRLWSRYGF